MKRNEALERKKREIMHRLSTLPRKVLQLYGRENVAEFILHELGKEDIFNLKKAAYVVDNPDFDCIKGVAGYCKPESFSAEKNIWDNPEDFTAHMENSEFHKKIRCLCKPSCVKQGASDDQIVNEIADELGFEHPAYYSWTLKNNNHGILLYEKDDDQECDCDYLYEGLYLIGFCPIY